MDAFRLTEEAKRQLHTFLDSNYRPKSFANLGSSIHDAINEVWAHLLPRFVIVRSAELFGASRYEAKACTCEINSSRYRLTVNTAVGSAPKVVNKQVGAKADLIQIGHARDEGGSNSVVLERPRRATTAVTSQLYQTELPTKLRSAVLLLEPIGFIPADGSMLQQSIVIQPLGGYSELVLCYPDCIPLTENQLDATANLCQSIVNVAYRWTESLIVEAIKESTKRLSIGLYSYVRNMMGPELACGIVFSCLLEGEDFVILDDIAAAGIFELAAISGGSYALSPIATAAKLLGEVVGIKDSVIKDVAERSETFELPLTGSDATHYYRNDPELYDSLRAVWGNGFTCTPILKNEKFTIVAFAPTSRRNEIVPRLEMYSADLEERASNQLKHLRKHLALVRDLGLANILAATESKAVGHRTRGFGAIIAGVKSFGREYGVEEFGKGIGAGLAALIKALHT